MVNEETKFRNLQDMPLFQELLVYQDEKQNLEGGLLWKIKIVISARLPAA